MGKIRVAVIYGGRSTEHGISVVSAGSVLAALDPTRYDVIGIGIDPDGRWVLAAGDPATHQISGRTLPQVGSGAAVTLAGDPTVPGLMVTEPGQAMRILDSVDVAFPVLHGRFGEDGTIQGLFEMAGIPYVGSGVFASAAGMDKEFTKKLLAAEGLEVGRYVVLRGRDLKLHAGSDLDGDVSAGSSDLNTEEIRALGLPVFVKPARAGSSVGITKVTNWDDLLDAVVLAFAHDTKVLIEAAHVGREIECGVLEGLDGHPRASVPAEIRLVRGHDWYDFDAKYLDDACEFDVPADLSPELSDAVRDAACRAFTALDCAGLARVDFFVGPDGPVVNEVNTMPGFTPISMFPRMWEATGVPYPQLVDMLISSALRRG
ncbi:D-alanine--D-alanine ligase [Jatrophihabitans sp. GAS493]|uniref:D-alanine--D-alanine ligase family protein n=1 Tax=Jatrophihabitans sp. GAS493 TaxID=1907575 RepID=UPI000BB77C27|nr:D-alanine--D-alanine ligase family protein [Jatrophihabitans sp. GAS493]SOD73414.1 D-alanine--D-alanine ligase [Jatrophihabitans sp. GAS493]